MNGSLSGLVTQHNAGTPTRRITENRDMDHLSALELHLSNERERLAAATTETERELRRVYVAQCEREVAGERAFLGSPAAAQSAGMDDAAILAELGL